VGTDKLEEILLEFRKEANSRFQVSRLVVARVRDLEVHEVNFPFEVRESDGKERIVVVSGRRTINM
jgi:hypothetical protein